MEKFYVVDGWDGDMMFYHNRENAMKEFNRRVPIADNYTVEENNEDYIEYRWYDKRVRDNYFLTFFEATFCD